MKNNVKSNRQSKKERITLIRLIFSFITYLYWTRLPAICAPLSRVGCKPDSLNLQYIEPIPLCCTCCSEGKIKMLVNHFLFPTRCGEETKLGSLKDNIFLWWCQRGSSFNFSSGSKQKRFRAQQELVINQLVKLTIHLAFSFSDCKPLWAFEEITPRSYKIKSAEQLELFVASVVKIFQASDSGTQVQEKMAKVALQWATSCSSRHYAGRSFQVFRALKVPLSWSMLSDVLSRLVESVGDGSEDVQVI